MNLLKFSLLRFLLPLLLPFSLQAAVFYVDGQAGRDAGPGSKSRPFKSITKALSRLHKGDTLILKRGVYTRPLHNIPSGSRLKPTVIRAADGHHVEIRYPQKALRIDGDHIEIRGIVFNGLYGAAPVADINGSHLLIDGCEFKNSSRDIMTIGDVGDITIRNSSLHHGLSWYKKTGKEPHGISTDGVRGLTIRNCDIYQITGDAIQISPSRRDWDNVRIEDCRLWVAPLSATEVEASGLPARAVGMILAASVPCTLASAAVWTRRAGGNDATSLLVTMATNLSCFLVTPAWLLFLASRTTTAMRFSDMVLKLLLLIVLPIVLAQLLRTIPAVGRWATANKTGLGVYAQLGILTMVLLAAVHGGQTLDSLQDQAALLIGQIALVLALVGLLHTAAWWIGFSAAGKLNLAREEQIAVAFAGSQKTLTVGLVVALQFGGLVVLPMLAYHVEQLLIDTLLADRLRTN